MEGLQELELRTHKTGGDAVGRHRLGRRDRRAQRGPRRRRRREVRDRDRDVVQPSELEGGRREPPRWWRVGSPSTPGAAGAASQGRQHPWHLVIGRTDAKSRRKSRAGVRKGLGLYYL